MSSGFLFASKLFVVVVQSLSCVQLFVTPWTAAHQSPLSSTNSRNLLKLMSIELVMSSNLLILCCSLLLLPSIIPSIRLFSNESVLPVRWPKYWSFSFSISPSNQYSGLNIHEQYKKQYKQYEKPRQHIKKQRHDFANQDPSSQGYGFSVVMYGCENWTIKKAEHRRIDAFELWCWRRLL